MRRQNDWSGHCTCILSAKSEAALVDLAARYRLHLQEQPDLALGNLCYTAATARNQFPHRLALVAATTTELTRRLLAVQQNDAHVDLRRGTVGQHPPHVAFLFTGQGSQYVDMGRELYATEPSFRATLERCEALYQEYTGESLLAVLYPETGDTKTRGGPSGHATRSTTPPTPNPPSLRWSTPWRPCGNVGVSNPIF